MSAAGAVIAGACVAGAAAAGLCAAVVWSGPVDPPGVRSAHLRPTPTSGGLAIMAGAAIGAMLCATLLGRPSPGLTRHEIGAGAATLAFAGGLGLVGAMDDLLDFGTKAKLVVQILLAFGFSIFVARIEVLPLGLGASVPLGPIAGVLGTTLWIVVATNAVNFMDGANGLAAGAMAVALSALAIAALQSGSIALGGAALAGAAASTGLLPWNLGGRLFQGDAGALFSSFLFAGLAVLASSVQSRAHLYLYFGPLALLPFLTDVLLTLLMRARRGESLFQAHRGHLYQLWLRHTGKPHGALAWRAALIMAAFAAGALALQQGPEDLKPIGFGAGLLIAICGWVGLRRKLGINVTDT